MRFRRSERCVPRYLLYIREGNDLIDREILSCAKVPRRDPTPLALLDDASPMGADFWTYEDARLLESAACRVRVVCTKTRSG